MVNFNVKVVSFQSEGNTEYMYACNNKEEQSVDLIKVVFIGSQIVEEDYSRHSFKYEEYNKIEGMGFIKDVSQSELQSYAMRKLNQVQEEMYLDEDEDEIWEESCNCEDESMDELMEEDMNLCDGCTCNGDYSNCKELVEIDYSDEISLDVFSVSNSISNADSTGDEALDNAIELLRELYMKTLKQEEE